MKAVICKAFGPIDDLQLGDFPSRVPGPGEVRVAVQAAALNFADLLMVQGGYQLKPPLPFVPGMEAAGTVLDVGPDVTGIRPGQRVACGTYTGALAEQWTVKTTDLIPLADTVDFTAAAAFKVSYGTAWYALAERAALKPGETLVVHGAAGGVGLAAVEVGRELGARVIGSVGSDDKFDVVRAYGASDVFNYATEDVRKRLKALTGGKGADVIFDVVGGDVFEQSLRCVAWGGRLLPIGFAGGRIPNIPANLPLLKGYSVVGVFYGASFVHDPPAMQRTHAKMASWLAQGRIRPHVGAVLPLEEAVAGLRLLAERKVKGKVVLSVR